MTTDKTSSRTTLVNVTPGFFKKSWRKVKDKAQGHTEGAEPVAGAQSIDGSPQVTYDHSRPATGSQQQLQGSSTQLQHFQGASPTQQSFQGVNQHQTQQQLQEEDPHQQQRSPGLHQQIVGSTGGSGVSAFPTDVVPATIHVLNEEQVRARLLPNENGSFDQAPVSSPRHSFQQNQLVLSRRPLPNTPQESSHHGESFYDESESAESQPMALSERNYQELDDFTNLLVKKIGKYFGNRQSHKDYGFIQEEASEIRNRAKAMLRAEIARANAEIDRNWKDYRGDKKRLVINHEEVIKSKNEAYRNLLSEKNTLSRDLHIEQNLNDQLKEDRDSCRKKRDEYKYDRDNAWNEIDDVKKERDTARAERDEYITKYRQANTDSQRVKQQQDIVKQFEDSLNTTRAENEVLQQTAKRHAQDMKEMNTKVAQLEYRKQLLEESQVSDRQTIERLKGEKRSLENQIIEANNNLEARQAEIESEAQNRLAGAKAKYNDSLILVKQEYQNKAKDDKTAWQEWAQKLRDDHAADIEAHQTKYAKLKNNTERDINNLLSTHSAEKTDLINKHAAAINVQKTKNTADAAQHTHAIAELTRKQKATTDALRADVKEATDQREFEIKRLQGEHASAIARITSTAQEAKKQHESRMVILREEHATALTEARDALSTQANQLKQDHLDATQSLRQQNGELNQVLLTRDQNVHLASLFSTDGLPRKADDQIKEAFTAIQQAVLDFARKSWKSRPQVWTDRELKKRNSQHMDRAIKTAIVQDMIWTVLYAQIFCSPFHMFGDAGKTLEQEWLQGFDPDSDPDHEPYAWPPASVKAERWRYMTLSGCHEALLVVVPSTQDPRAAIKFGFRQSQQQTLRSMMSELEQVLDLSQEDEKSLQQVIRAAAIKWLDFGMHRCRFEIRLAGDLIISAEEKLAAFQKRSLSLTETPTIGRYGDSDGLNLEEFSVIRGCSGKALTIP